MEKEDDRRMRQLHRLHELHAVEKLLQPSMPLEPEAGGRPEMPKDWKAESQD
jgi:hypothetical protein